ncbi:MAG: hypothetical protein M0Z81_05430 [Deltaproteobacteria bacterium]|jgi:hypothetical protein|nr:hypothetical protein [Deltaproteobacteria bacterium]
MKNQSRSLSILLTVFTAAALFAFSPCSWAQTNKSLVEGQKAIMQGAKQMMAANKRIMAAAAKKGIKDPELAAAQKQMEQGYDMVVKGNGMMAGTTVTQGQQMMKKGAKMMLNAQSTTYTVAKKRGLVRICAIDLHNCYEAQKKIEHGALQWYFGGAGI